MVCCVVCLIPLLASQLAKGHPFYRRSLPECSWGSCDGMNDRAGALVRRS